MIEKIKVYVKSNPKICFKFAIYAVILIVAAIMGYKNNHDKFVLQFWIAVQIIMLFLIFRLIYKTILRKKALEFYKKSFGAVKKMFQNFAKLSKRFFELFGHKDKGVYIEGKSTYSFLFKKKDKEFSKKAKAKKRKYSDISDNYEKLRFIYGTTVSKKIKKGADIKKTSTPHEIYKNYSESKTEQELFLCYNDVRYSERVEVDEQKVRLFSDTLEKQDKK